MDIPDDDRNIHGSDAADAAQTRLARDGSRFLDTGMDWGWCGAGRLGDGGLDDMIEKGDVLDLDPVFLRDDEDGGGFLEADAFAESVVGVDLSSEEAVGIDDEGHGVTVGLEVLAREVLQVVLGGYGCLVGEDGATVLLGVLGRDLVLDVAGDDGGVMAPDVSPEGEVVADERNFVLVDGRVDDREGVGTGGALEVFELVDGDLGSGGRLDHGGVFEGGAGVWRGGGLGEGGCAAWDGEQKSGG
jgi:hypothetical protein